MILNGSWWPEYNPTKMGALDASYNVIPDPPYAGMNGNIAADPMLDVRDGIPYVLDMNQNPDISEGFSFAQAAEAGGCSYADLIGKIVMLAAERLEKMATDPQP